MGGISKPNNPLVEAVLNRAATFGEQHEILVTGNQTVDDLIPAMRSATPKGVSLWAETTMVTAGTYTLDLQVNGVTVLSAPFDLTSLAAKTLTPLTLASVPALSRGDYFTTVAVSTNVDLTGSGLKIIFEF